MQAQGPASSALLDYIASSAESFERFFFFTYLYASTYFGLPQVAAKATLVPFAHDEWPIHASMWDAFFARPQCIVFSTPEERAFLERRFPKLALRGPTIGAGVAIPTGVDPQRFRERYGIAGPFVLYLGRIDRSKGLERLLDGFAAYKRLRDDDLTLVLAGRAEGQTAVAPGVRAIGFIDEGLKYDALAAADVVVMPSEFESLSLVLLEAWSVERPVLVTAASDVLVGQARRAQGGLWFADDAEFAAALDVLRGPDGARLGRSGRAYVERTYPWSRVVDEYATLVRL
jgi:glycosyltransferase involved in cell wall biosynthesis